MIHNRLKKIIFDKLYKDLSKAEIIPFEDNLWFINRENKYWYLEYKKRGDLWWRFNFFDNFFHVFSLERSEYEPLICEWVEEVLNCKVIRLDWDNPSRIGWVEEVLNYEVTTPEGYGDGHAFQMEEALNHKVIKPFSPPFMDRRGIEEVLNYKVTTLRDSNPADLVMVEKVLNYEVTTLCPQEIASSDIAMEEALNCNVSFLIENHE